MTQQGAGDLAPPRRLTGLLLAVPLILLLGFSTSDLRVVTLASHLAAGGATLRPHSWVLAHRSAAATEPAAAPAACHLDVGQWPIAKACHLLNHFSHFRFKVCVPATKLAIQTPKRQPGAEGKAVMRKGR